MHLQVTSDTPVTSLCVKPWFPYTGDCWFMFWSEMWQCGVTLADTLLWQKYWFWYGKSMPVRNQRAKCCTWFTVYLLLTMIEQICGGVPGLCHHLPLLQQEMNTRTCEYHQVERGGTARMSLLINEEAWSSHISNMCSESHSHWIPIPLLKQSNRPIRRRRRQLHESQKLVSDSFEWSVIIVAEVKQTSYITTKDCRRNVVYSWGCSNEPDNEILQPAIE